MGHNDSERSSNRPSRKRGSSSKVSASPWGYGIVALLSGVFCAGFMAATIALACVGMQDTLCNGIERIKRGEQLICHPRKTRDVKVSDAFDQVTAYRYKMKMLPETELRTTKWEVQKTLSRDSNHNFRFTISTGGSINLTCHTNNDTRVDFYLMTTAQFNEFKLHRRTQSEWSRRNTSFASTMFTTNNSGTYYIVMDAQYELSQVNETIIVTTPVYKVSNATAKETCSNDCKFGRVHKDEVVILEYFGLFDSLSVKMYSGKALDPDFLDPLITTALIAAVFSAGMIAFGAVALRKVQRKQKEEATDGNNTPTTTAGTTPSSDPATPLISNTTKNDDPPPVYYGTDLPEYGI